MFKEEDLTEFSLTKDMIIKTRYEIKPIEANGDIIGLVILISEKRLEENDDIVVNIASKFLGKNVEEQFQMCYINAYNLKVMKERRIFFSMIRESYNGEKRYRKIF